MQGNLVGLGDGPGHTALTKPSTIPSRDTWEIDEWAGARSVGHSVGHSVGAFCGRPTERALLWVPVRRGETGGDDGARAKRATRYWVALFLFWPILRWGQSESPERRKCSGDSCPLMPGSPCIPWHCPLTSDRAISPPPDTRIFRSATRPSSRSRWSSVWSASCSTRHRLEHTAGPTARIPCPKTEEPGEE